MTDFSANRKKNDLGVLQLNLDIGKYVYANVKIEI